MYTIKELIQDFRPLEDKLGRITLLRPIVLQTTNNNNYNNI